MWKQIFILSLVLILVVQNGCTNKILVTYDQLENGNLVQIKTKAKATYDGVISDKQPAFVVLQTDRNKHSFNKIARDNISYVLAEPSVYDYQKRIISEWEIRDNQRSKNKILYIIGGAGLSFGTSFFIGSMIHRAMSNSEYRNTALWTTTGIGTAIGTFLFYRTGNKKDREHSIMEIRERRYAAALKEINRQKIKREKVQSELEKEKSGRERQDTEMKRLMDRIKEREKKKEKGSPD